MHAGAPQPTTLSARMHALQRAAGSSASSAIQAAESGDPPPPGRGPPTQTVDAHMHAGELAAAAAAGVPTPAPPAAAAATGGSSTTMDACAAARVAAEFDQRWRPDYPSVAPLVDTGRCVAKVAECGWCVARGCSRKSAVAASGALLIRILALAPCMHACIPGGGSPVGIKTRQ